MKLKLLIVTALLLLVACNAWAATYYVASAAQVAAGSWDTNAKTTDPTFTGGDKPTGFCTGCVYGTDLVLDKPYFSLQAGSPALGTGATLGSPYNGAINWAGTNSLLVRPSGGYDIGAYQLTGSSANTVVMYFGVTF